VLQDFNLRGRGDLLEGAGSWLLRSGHIRWRRGGLFVTNATNAPDLEGQFDTWLRSVGRVSIEFSRSGGIWVASALLAHPRTRFGRFSLTHYPTFAKTAGPGC